MWLLSKSTNVIVPLGVHKSSDISKEVPLDKCTCTDLDLPAHSCSLIRIFTGSFWIAKDTKFLHANNNDSDQTVQLLKLIHVFSLGAHVRR